MRGGADRHASGQYCTGRDMSVGSNSTVMIHHSPGVNDAIIPKADSWLQYGPRHYLHTYTTENISGKHSMWIDDADKTVARGTPPIIYGASDCHCSHGA